MQAAKKTILVADDDEGILDVLRIILELKGYRVETLTGADGLESIHEAPPNLILLDIWMSGMDGREICKRLKKQVATRAIPIILVSANSEMSKSAAESGANDYLSKPFEMSELLEKVAKHCT